MVPENANLPFRKILHHQRGQLKGLRCHFTVYMKVAAEHKE
jgi:hypothetical protein